MFKTVFEGIVSFDDLRKYMEFVNRDTKLPESLNILIDIRNAVLDISSGNIRDLSGYNFFLNPYYRKTNNAILRDHPENTAFLLLYECLSRSKHYRFKVFNLPKNALEWLKIFPLLNHKIITEFPGFGTTTEFSFSRDQASIRQASIIS